VWARTRRSGCGRGGEASSAELTWRGTAGSVPGARPHLAQRLEGHLKLFAWQRLPARAGFQRRHLAVRARHALQATAAAAAARCWFAGGQHTATLLRRSSCEGGAMLLGGVRAAHLVGDAVQGAEAVIHRWRLQPAGAAGLGNQSACQDAAGSQADAAKAPLPPQVAARNSYACRAGRCLRGRRGRRTPLRGRPAANAAAAARTAAGLNTERGACSIEDAARQRMAGAHAASIRCRP
jgi:hypothetical protein